jgi:ATP-dependent RNA helicase DOB1
MKDSIKNIITGQEIDNYFKYLVDRLYKNGPTSISDMEMLSYLQLFHPVIFNNYKDSILNYMAVFYKDTERNSLKDAVFGQYKKYISETYKFIY